MATLSIIIPARNERHIAQMLARLPIPSARLEILVVGGGSDDTTDKALAAIDNVQYVRSPVPQRATQCNVGAALATHPHLLFLHADTSITQAGIDAIHRALEDPRISGGSFRFRLDNAPRRFRMTQWGANFRSRVLRRPYGDQGIFCRRDTFQHLGGFPTTPLMDDVIMIHNLKRLGQFVILPHYATTSARRIVQHGVIKTTCRNWVIIVAHRLGVAPERLATWYRGRVSS